MDTIQDILGAFLTTNGQHVAAAEALSSTERTQWTRLAELAIRTSPDEYRTQTMQTINLALDRLENGGRNEAVDVIVRAFEHPFKNETWYRGFFKRSKDGTEEVAGFIADTVTKVIDRLVGAYVVRNITLDLGPNQSGSNNIAFGRAGQWVRESPF